MINIFNNEKEKKDLLNKKKMGNRGREKKKTNKINQLEILEQKAISKMKSSLTGNCRKKSVNLKMDYKRNYMN